MIILDICSTVCPITVHTVLLNIFLFQQLSLVSINRISNHDFINFDLGTYHVSPSKPVLYRHSACRKIVPLPQLTVHDVTSVHAVHDGGSWRRQK